MKWVHGIVNGHGGISPKTGEYVTAPKKMATFQDGETVYEGVINRQRKEAIMMTNALSYNGVVEIYDLVPDWQDVSLPERGTRALALNEKLNKKGKQLIVWEIHHNAFNSAAHGTEVWTTPGETYADPAAEIFIQETRKRFPDLKLRADKADGDSDKEKYFWLIKYLEAHGIPAVLPELYFFDNQKEHHKYGRLESNFLWAHVFIQSMMKFEKAVPLK